MGKQTLLKLRGGRGGGGGWGPADAGSGNESSFPGPPFANGTHQNTMCHSP